MININTVVEEAIKDISFPCSYLENIEIDKPEIYATYFNLPQSPAFHTYDQVKATIAQVQFNIYCSKGLSYRSAASELLSAMKAAGFEVKDGPELYDSAVKTLQKTYTFMYEIEEE